MAHLHSAGWSSGDWHRPIINLPFHWCPLDFFLLPFFFLSSLLLIFKLFIYLFIYSLLLSFFLSLLSFLFFSFLLSPPFFKLCLSSSTFYHLSMRVFVMSIDTRCNFELEFIA